MFMEATVVVKVVMAGLLLASILSWTLLLIKLFEFGSLNRKTDNFLESFRGARTIADMRAVATQGRVRRQPAGRHGRRRHRGNRTVASVGPVGHRRSPGFGPGPAPKPPSPPFNPGLAKRLSGGQQFLASVGSIGPFVGLFGTVYGIMNSSSASRNPTRPTWPSLLRVSLKPCWPPASACSPLSRPWCSTTTSTRASPVTAPAPTASPLSC